MATLFQSQVPVRMNMNTPLAYQFLTSNGSIFDLTPYANCSLEVINQNDPIPNNLTTVAGAIQSPATNGQVLAYYSFTVQGIWNSQFKVWTDPNNPVYGNPAQFRVVPNIDSLSPNQTMSY